MTIEEKIEEAINKRIEAKLVEYGVKGMHWGISGKKEKAYRKGISNRERQQQKGHKRSYTSHLARAANLKAKKKKEPILTWNQYRRTWSGRDMTKE